MLGFSKTEGSQLFFTNPQACRIDRRKQDLCGEREAMCFQNTSFEIAVVDALSVDVRELYKKESYKHSSTLIVVDDLTKECSNAIEAGQ